jgi:hypothetical protein
LVTAFDNKQGHDAYQPPNEIHKKFVDECSHLWAKVVIYDSETA